MVTTAAASPFGEDWDKVLKQMQESLRTPAWQAAIKQIQAIQTLEFQKALKGFAAAVKLPPGVDFSALSQAIVANQNSEVQAAIKRLTSDSAARWTEVAKQISTPTIPRLEPDIQRVIADLQRDLREAHAPGFASTGWAIPATPGKPAHLETRPGFDWIDALPRKAQIRLLVIVLTVIASLTQGTASATGVQMPPGLAEFTAAALVLAGALNEAIGPPDDDPEADD
jgi:hypothetical protein